MRKLSIFLLAAALAAPALAANLDQFFQPGKIRVLILTGRNNHDWRSTTPFLRKILRDTGRFDVRVVEEPVGLSSEALRPYQVIVLNYCGPRWGPTAEHALLTSIQEGRGLVVVHGASYAFSEREVLADHHRKTGIREPPWPAYFHMIGATWTEASGHGKRHIFEVKFTKPRHPITEGMGPGFSISDELYHKLKIAPGIQVIGSAYDDPSIGGTGRNEPILWTLHYGQGRVFHTTLGHDVSAMMSDGFVTTFDRGAEWAASGKVTLPATLHAAAPKTNPVRVELVIGGHDFPPSLFQVFSGRDDLATNVIYQPDAYTADRLRDTDVIVQYDLMQSLPEERKANLKRYLEQGKGLVVLHHAVADYQDWKWWWQDVVGGRYVLKGQTDMPLSDYKHGIWMRTRTLVNHPVTKGVPPMLIHDEAYKNMWFSPKIRKLITTDSPDADGPLAWVSPYRKARVVVILLGHGSEAHAHPDYQRLVHNAILWTAHREP